METETMVPKILNPSPLHSDQVLFLMYGSCSQLTTWHIEGIYLLSRKVTHLKYNNLWLISGV